MYTPGDISCLPVVVTTTTTTTPVDPPAVEAAVEAEAAQPAVAVVLTPAFTG
jgi:hypothetical protein